MKIVTSLEEYGSLIKRVSASKEQKIKQNNKNEDFSGCNWAI